MELAPGIDGSRDANRKHPARRDHFAIQLLQLGLHLFKTEPERRTAAAVQAIELVFLRAVNDREEVAADPIRDRFHEAESSVRRDRRVDCGAAAFENVE